MIGLLGALLYGAMVEEETENRIKKSEPKPMHWIDTAECRFKYSMDSRFRCSVCGKGYDFKHRFCPNCGKKADNPSGVILKVKMDEVEE